VGWRRRRRVVLAVAVLPLLLAPWPQASLLFTPAWAASLHRSPTGFNAASIVAGQAVYQQHCLRCHGADGRGEGPDAARLPMWPPTLNNTLMWRRLDGELFHHVRAGLRGRDGAITMPGFAGVLSDEQVWQVLDYLQANASGQTLREAGAWVYPVRLPDAPVRCRQGRRQTLTDFTGQRVRLTVFAPGAALPQDDPRIDTVVLGAPPGADVACRLDSPEAADALALVLGVPLDELPGHQVLADRDGWLRVRGQPGSAWSEDDLVCKASTVPQAGSTGAGPPPGTALPEAGLDALIRRMDAEPVRARRGGFPH
jgi:mono/diheme cytochrome c family protein